MRQYGSMVIAAFFFLVTVADLDRGHYFTALVAFIVALVWFIEFDKWNKPRH